MVNQPTGEITRVGHRLHACPVCMEPAPHTGSEVFLCLRTVWKRCCQVVYDASGELKVVVAWSTDTVLVSFRGSTTAANWVADAMVSTQDLRCGP